jgi:ParB-like chromosome segregation protein Spo0J
MTDPKSMKIELLDIDKIHPYTNNAKNHPPEQIDRLAATITRFGWDQPIVVDKEGVIIKGHGRRLAAIKLGLKKVPVLVRSDMTQNEADAARISDNAVISNSFDTRMMQSELQRLMSIPEIEFTTDDLGLTQKDQQLLLSALDTASTEALMMDTHKDVEEHKTAEEKRVAEADDETIPVADALGFKRLNRVQARVFSRAIAEAESETGKEGVAGFVEWLELKVA